MNRFRVTPAGYRDHVLTDTELMECLHEFRQSMKRSAADSKAVHETYYREIAMAAPTATDRLQEHWKRKRRAR